MYIDNHTHTHICLCKFIDLVFDSGVELRLGWGSCTTTAVDVSWGWGNGAEGESSIEGFGPAVGLKLGQWGLG